MSVLSQVACLLDQVSSQCKQAASPKIVTQVAVSDLSPHLCIIVLLLRARLHKNVVNGHSGYFRKKSGCSNYQGNWTTRAYANSRTGQVAHWTTRGFTDAAGSSTCCFNCMISLCGLWTYNTSDRIKTHTQENINK